MKQIGALFLLAYALALLQMSFFVHFFPAGFVVNFIALLVVALSIFERAGSYASFAAALFGGSFIDIFSGGFIGVWAAGLLFGSLLIQKIIEGHVRIPIPKKF